MNIITMLQFMQLPSDIVLTFFWEELSLQLIPHLLQSINIGCSHLDLTPFSVLPQLNIVNWEHSYCLNFGLLISLPNDLKVLPYIKDKVL